MGFGKRSGIFLGARQPTALNFIWVSTTAPTQQVDTPQGGLTDPYTHPSLPFPLRQFNAYLKSYFAAHPELADVEYPTFDDFDTDGSGYVMFGEWKKFIEVSTWSAFFVGAVLG